jgi:putative membrane protein
LDRLIIRIAINAVAIYAAVGTGWIKGVEAQNNAWWAFALLGLIFGPVNLLVRPILKVLTCPLILLTLGLFTFVINGVLFWLTGLIGQLFDIGYVFASGGDGVLAAFLGGLVVGIVNAVLTLVFKDELKNRRPRTV